MKTRLWVRFAVPALLFAAGALLQPPSARAHIRITTDVSWSGNIRSILRERCMPCHSPKGIAPSYADFTIYGTDSKPGARAWATAIEEEILTGRMPPWDADPRYGEFTNARRLSQDEIDQIVAWARGGGPQGPRRDLEAPPETAADAWYLGTPDLLVEPSQPFTLAAGKVIDRARFEIPIVIEAPTWITAYELRPAHSDAVQRMTAWIVDPLDSEPERLEVEVQVPYDPFAGEDEAEPTRWREMPRGRRFLGQWLRGDAPVLFPDSAGKRLLPGSSIELVVDYHRYGQEGRDQDLVDLPRLGLHLARDPQEVEKITESMRLAIDGLRIKKGSRKPETLQVPLPDAVELIALNPQVGDLVRSLEVVAHFPDGRSKTLLFIPDYRPEWPASFHFEKPVPAPAGTRLELRASFGEPEDRRGVPQELALVVDYTLDDHLVLPEVIEPPAPASGPRGGMFTLFGADREPGDADMETPKVMAGMPPADPMDPNAAAHMDHSPLHGGQFFMAQNNYHHLEGTLSEPGAFRLYVYDDFKRPIDPRNFAGRVVFERYDLETGEFSETSFPLDAVGGADYLLSRIPEPLPVELYASVWMAGEQLRYDFYFEELTEEPAQLPRANALIAGEHSHQRPPLAIPETPAAIISELQTRLQHVEQTYRAGNWTLLYVPAFDAADLVEALLGHLDGLGARGIGRARVAVGRVRQSAVELDRTGDLADSARTQQALERFRTGIEELVAVFAGG